MCIDLSIQAIDGKIFLPHVHTHQKVIIAQEDFTYQMNRIIHSDDSG